MGKFGIIEDKKTGLPRPPSTCTSAGCGEKTFIAYMVVKHEGRQLIGHASDFSTGDCETGKMHKGYEFQYYRTRCLRCHTRETLALKERQMAGASSEVKDHHELLKEHFA